MSKQGAVRNMCGRKMSFHSQSDATKYAHRRGFSARAYECPVCRKYHLTSKGAR